MPSDSEEAANFYDAVVLGSRMSGLLAGALLAKRGVRVLVLGQGVPAPRYTIGDVEMPRAAFSLLAAESPAVSRVFSELALTPLTSPRFVALRPGFQVVTPEHRMSFSRDQPAFTSEVDREFPEVLRTADDVARGIREIDERFDAMLSKDLVWPPGNFLEGRELRRAHAGKPFGGERAALPLSDLPEQHPLREMVAAAARFSDPTSSWQGGNARELRLISGWLRSAAVAPDGLATLQQMLVESIRTHNGAYRPAQSVDMIHTGKGGIRSIQVAKSGEQIGCEFVLSTGPVNELARLLDDRNALDEMVAQHGEPRPRFCRYTLNMLVAADGIPGGMARDVLLLGRGGTNRSALPLRLQRGAPDPLGRSLLTIESLLPARLIDADGTYVRASRERIRSDLQPLLPFLDRHLLLVDSPHDGRDIQDVDAGRSDPAPEPWSRGPQTMQTVHAFSRRRVHDTCALPTRTPVRNLLMCCDQVVPGLGMEGDFLTAWSAARIVTRRLGRNWMNRGRWLKVEL